MTYIDANNYEMTYSTEVHHVFADWIYSGTGLGANPNSYFSTNCMFKVVVIPASYKKANINLNNYAEVKAVYNLMD